MKPDELIAATVKHFGGISEVQAREVWRVAAYNAARRAGEASGNPTPALALPPAEWGGKP